MGTHTPRLPLSYRDQVQLSLRLAHLNHEVPGIVLIHKAPLEIVFLLLGPKASVCLTEDFASVKEVGHWKQRLGIVVSLATRSGSGTGEAFFIDTLLPL